VISEKSEISEKSPPTGAGIGTVAKNISAKSAVTPFFPVPARRSFASRVQIGGVSAPSARRQTGQWLCLTHYSLAKVPLVIQRPCPLAGRASRRWAVVFSKLSKTAQSRGRTERTLLTQR
jgi:hypothetical protein